jgi:kynurenine formamidase
MGALNRITPAKVREATRTVVQGKTYNLGNIVSTQTLAYGTRVFKPYVYTLELGGANQITGFDDYMDPAFLGVGSQMDSTYHICVGEVCFNQRNRSEIFVPNELSSVEGLPDGTNVALDGLQGVGVHTLKPFVTRGVVLNIPPIFGKTSLDVGDEITCEVILQALDRQKTSIKEGDVVLLHTGFAIGSDPRDKLNEPGLSISGAQYLIEKKVVAVGADTIGVESYPTEEGNTIWPGSLLPVHTQLIPKNGIYILEVMNTGVLVDEGITEFMFVMNPIRIQGGVQSLINPVAIK